MNILNCPFYHKIQGTIVIKKIKHTHSHKSTCYYMTLSLAEPIVRRSYKINWSTYITMNLFLQSWPNCLIHHYGCFHVAYSFLVFYIARFTFNLKSPLTALVSFLLCYMIQQKLRIFSKYSRPLSGQKKASFWLLEPIVPDSVEWRALVKHAFVVPYSKYFPNSPYFLQ